MFQWAANVGIDQNIYSMSVMDTRALPVAVQDVPVLPLHLKPEQDYQKLKRRIHKTGYGDHFSNDIWKLVASLHWCIGHNI